MPPDPIQQSNNLNSYQTGKIQCIISMWLGYIAFTHMCLASPYTGLKSAYICAHTLEYLTTDDIVNNSTITSRFTCDLLLAILNKYLIIKGEELAVLQVRRHYYYLLNVLCRIIVRHVVSESMWVESK